uniref:Glycoprotein vIgFam2.5 n=1 Tax=Elephant endotheliotropic herpesvirus 1A TaxID=759753 RepID=A0A8B6NQ38_ELHV1|nr:glycoprotein vIgFam2.5 [Elephant endotheliotropic herpesvirus 1A]WNZ34475.1 protein E53 [Elephant endotheliotropic herpesvirus 1A]
MNLWIVKNIYIYVYVLLSLRDVISKIHVGQNITFGLNDSTCNNPATVTWLYNNEFIANWSKPNVTYPKTVRKSVNLTNPCSMTIYNAACNDSGNYTLRVCERPESSRCTFTFLVDVTNFSNNAVPSFAALPCAQASVILLLISIFLNI